MTHSIKILLIYTCLKITIASLQLQHLLWCYKSGFYFFYLSQSAKGLTSSKISTHNRATLEPDQFSFIQIFCSSQVLCTSTFIICVKDQQCVASVQYRPQTDIHQWRHMIGYPLSTPPSLLNVTRQMPTSCAYHKDEREPKIHYDL